MTTIRSDISNGPCKFELMMALFDRKSVNTRDVEFKLGANDSTIVAHVVITGVEIEDGSGEKWIFKGYVRNVAPTSEQSVPPPSRQCFGFYRTDSRRGWLELAT